MAIKMTGEKKDIRLLIFSHNGDFIGSSGLHKNDWRIPKAEIGYWIRTRKSGKGYATEAVRAISDYALHRLRFRRIEILISGSNKRSLGVVERLRFPLEGVLKMERVNPDGTVDDTHIYARIAQQDAESGAANAAPLA